jgi:hypothetical protein
MLVVLVSRGGDVEKRVTVLRVQLSVVVVWSCKLKVDFTVICKDGYCDMYARQRQEQIYRFLRITNNTLH